MKSVIKCWSEYFRNDPFRYLLLHKQGSYEYRNPDSVYVHQVETFETKEKALLYLDENIAKVDRDEWELFELAKE